jgi:type IV secretory pathway component VirB8
MNHNNDELVQREYSLEQSEKEILLKQLRAAHTANNQRRTIIKLFWIFYGIPVILGLVILILSALK